MASMICRNTRYLLVKNNVTTLRALSSSSMSFVNRRSCCCGGSIQHFCLGRRGFADDVKTSSTAGAEKRVTGVVKSWKGKMGIVTTPEGDDLKVYQNRIVSKSKPKYRSLFEGTTVEFSVAEGKKESLIAEGVTGVGGGPVPRYRHYDKNGRFVLRPMWSETDGSEESIKSANRRVGMVMSTKMKKTAVVEVILGCFEHPKYGKYITRKKSYACHDPQSKCRYGDIVEIEECKPMSKTKSHKVIDIIREEKYIDREDPNRLLTTEADFTETGTSEQQQ